MKKRRLKIKKKVKNLFVIFVIVKNMLAPTHTNAENINVALACDVSAYVFLSIF